MEPVPPPPEPVQVPTGPAPSELKFELLPIYFDLDMSIIRPGDAEILRRNAEAILAKAKAGLKADVLIEGHCCPLASEMYNIGLGMRRAEAAKAYLVGLGVDAALLTTETFGEANPPYTDPVEYYLDRRCEFKWKY
jgi:peptidoglycan-associated lipoprotein